MEDVGKIERFLRPGSGSGYGDGSGYGYSYGSGDGDGSGYGYGYGSGYGDGYGYDYGYGDGSGYGYGSDYGYGDGSGYGYGYGYDYGSGDDYYGDGMKGYNGLQVYYIDGVPTLIYSVVGNNARAAVIRKDLTLDACFVAKVGNFFAHGKTLHEAMQAAQEKYDENKPLEERIKEFMQCAPTLESVCSNAWLFAAHHTLTGSCLMGRKNFAKEHDIDVEHGRMTVREFIELTRNAYGRDAIESLLDAYNKKTNN